MRRLSEVLAAECIGPADRVAIWELAAEYAETVFMERTSGRTSGSLPGRIGRITASRSFGPIVLSTVCDPVLALSELARPISRVLEQELALPYKRIDSLAADEGHRPYASEYRRHEEPAFEGMPGTQITQSATPNAAATQTGHTTLVRLSALSALIKV